MDLIQVEPVYEDYQFQVDRYCPWKTQTRPCVVVSLTGQEYHTCFTTALWCSEKKDDYGEKDPYSGGVEEYHGADLKTVFGLMGEISWAKLTDLTVDLKYRVGGDRQDFIFHGFRTDIKMGMPSSNHKTNPHITATRYGRQQEKKQLYIAGFVEDSKPEERKAKVVFVGWTVDDELTLDKLAPSKYKNTRNYDIWYYELFQISELLV